ncbi:MAG: HU family DNA-binding protein [Elusimicrobia bacterium]|nr:HU family DNA-binding protein [Elusimicrobiota bacterium]
MNRSDIIQAVSRVLTTKKDALRAVEAVFDTMTQAMKAGDKVVISNFGTFRIKTRRAGQGRNPKTGQAVSIPPRRGVRFKASKNLLT